MEENSINMFNHSNSNINSNNLNATAQTGSLFQPKSKVSHQDFKIVPMSPVGRTNAPPTQRKGTQGVTDQNKLTQYQNQLLGLSPSLNPKQNSYNSPNNIRNQSVNIPEFRNNGTGLNTSMELGGTQGGNSELNGGSGSNGANIPMGDGQYRLEKTKQDLDDTIKDLDQKLNRVLMKQEYDYLKGYNIYVKRKEKELRDLIQKLSDKNQAAGGGGVSFKDDKGSTELQMHQLREGAIKSEKQMQELREKIKYWKNKAESFESEKNFLYKQTMETKKKNKLLKVAIGKLQSELETLTLDQEQKAKMESEIQKSQFFITDLMSLAEQSVQQINSGFTSGGFNSLKPSPRLLNQSTGQNGLENTNLQEVSTMQHSLLENSTFLQIPPKNKSMHKRYQSLVAQNTSRYANIPTENIKFEKFIDLLYKSKMSRDEIQTEVKSYVQVIETNYNDTIKELRVQNERLVKKLKKLQGDKVNNVIEKNELEAHFVECIEDVRKDIMKRRLKNEIVQKKKGLIPLSQLDSSTPNRNDEDAKEFEESLVKLAALAKGKIKLSDFNSKDKFNILDLFVNNEKTLIKIYEALFPNKNSSTQQQQAQKQMLQSHSQSLNGSNPNLNSQSFKSVRALNLNQIHQLGYGSIQSTPAPLQGLGSSNLSQKIGNQNLKNDTNTFKQDGSSFNGTTDRILNFENIIALGGDSLEEDPSIQILPQQQSKQTYAPQISTEQNMSMFPKIQNGSVTAKNNSISGSGSVQTQLNDSGLFNNSRYLGIRGKQAL